MSRRRAHRRRDRWHRPVLPGLALIPRKVSLTRRLAAYDGQRSSAFLPRYASAIRGRDSALSRRLGAALATFCAEQGWEFPSLRANLALADKSLEGFLATKVLLGVFGFLLGPADPRAARR